MNTWFNQLRSETLCWVWATFIGFYQNLLVSSKHLMSQRILIENIQQLLLLLWWYLYLLKMLRVLLRYKVLSSLKVKWKLLISSMHCKIFVPGTHSRNQLKMAKNQVDQNCKERLSAHLFKICRTDAKLIYLFISPWKLMALEKCSSFWWLGVCPFGLCLNPFPDCPARCWAFPLQKSGPCLKRCAQRKTLFNAKLTEE